MEFRETVIKEALADLLTSIAEADTVTKLVEVETAIEIFAAVTGGRDLDMSASRDKRRRATPVDTFAVLAELTFHERARLVRYCWLLAECDGEIHPAEETQIYTLADAIGVPRHDVARMQPDLSTTLRNTAAG